MTSNEEELLMDKFRNEYDKFPQGTLLKKQPPFTDYLLCTNDGVNIGIELTEIYHSEEAKQKSSTKEQITERILDELKKILPFKFSLDIELDVNRKIQKAKTHKLIKEMVTLCKNEYLHIDDKQGWEIENIEIKIEQIEDQNLKKKIYQEGFRNLPHGIASVSLYRYDKAGESWNSKAEGGTVPNLTDDYILPILNAKHEKAYTQCDYYWLIIKEGNYYVGSFAEISISTPIHTRFDKIFLFRTLEGEIIELTTSKK